MPEYQYIFDDALTRAKLGTLPLYGVSCSDFLSYDSAKAGNFTGTIRMDDRQYTSKQILDWTQPGKTRLWVERDGTLVWGGLVWTRTYQSDGRSMQISGQTFTSYPSTVFLDTASGAIFYGGSGATPSGVIRLAWQYLRNEISGESIPAYYNVGVTLEASHATGALPISGGWFDDDNRYLQQYIDDLLKLDVEFRIRVFYSTTDVRTAQLETHRKGLLGTSTAAADIVPVLRYPGDISKYWMTDSATVAAHKVKGLGTASGNATETFIGSDYSAGYIGLTLIKSYQTNDFAVLSANVNADVQLLKPAVQKPVYELSGSSVDMSFQLGDHRKVIIDDPYRYPDGPVSGTVRIMGWQLTPESSSGNESLALTIDDTTKLVTVGV